MASGKRASMREGPLADLFRKTEQAAEKADEKAPPTAPDEAGVPAPSTPAAQERRAPEPPPPHPRETGYPHPSLGTTEDAPPTPEPRVPTPQERLRHAFSADIPENILDRQPSPQRDPYAARAADEPTPWGTARPVGHPVLRVVGVGGAGVNAVNRMVEAQVEGVEFIAVNTDLQSLQQSTADITLHIGPQVTRGLGAGSNPDLGRQSAMEEYDRIKALLKGSDMVFIAAGAGGGTGTGAAPIVARIARELGALTVGIVTKPFGFEGNRRSAAADMGVQALADEVDTLIVVPNNKLLSVLDKQTSMVDAFRVADDVLRQGVQGISDLVTLPGLINLDFADVRTIMSEAGNALLGIGMGHGRGSRRRRRPLRDRVAAAGDLDGGRAQDPALDHRRAGPVAVGDQRGREGGQRGRPPRREHHLRRHGRREARLGGVGHRRRHRLHRGPRAPCAPRLRGAARRGARRAPYALGLHAPDRPRCPRARRSRVHSANLTA